MAACRRAPMAALLAGALVVAATVAVAVADDSGQPATGLAGQLEAAEAASGGHQASVVVLREVLAENQAGRLCSTSVANMFIELKQQMRSGSMPEPLAAYGRALGYATSAACKRALAAELAAAELKLSQADLAPLEALEASHALLLLGRVERQLPAGELVALLERLLEMRPAGHVSAAGLSGEAVALWTETRTRCESTYEELYYPLLAPLLSLIRWGYGTGAGSGDQQVSGEDEARLRRWLSLMFACEMARETGAFQAGSTGSFNLMRPSGWGRRLGRLEPSEELQVSRAHLAELKRAAGHAKRKGQRQAAAVRARVLGPIGVRLADRMTGRLGVHFASKYLQLLEPVASGGRH